MLVFQGSIHGNIQIKKGVNIHNNIQRIMFKEILQKISNIHNNIQRIMFKEILQKISNAFLPYHNSFARIK